MIRFVYDNVIKCRVDSYLSEQMEDMSRSRIQAHIKSGDITVNGIKVKTGYMLSQSDIIEAVFPEPEDTEIEAEDIPLDIVYEDNSVIVINKPKNMVVHPANGHYSGTLVNALMYHCKDSLSGINGKLRPGIVHRIDKDTTGLIIACKNDIAHNFIAAQLAGHSIEREYIALCYGNFTDDEGTIDLPIARSKADRKLMAVCSSDEGKNAVTHYRVLERFFKPQGMPMPITLIKCRLETGRTHQIRVHMSHMGHPLCGDETYGIKKESLKGNGQYLHAAVLGFIHPETKRKLRFEAPLPEYFEQTLKKLKSVSK